MKDQVSFLVKHENRKRKSFLEIYFQQQKTDINYFNFEILSISDMYSDLLRMGQEIYVFLLVFAVADISTPSLAEDT